MRIFSLHFLRVCIPFIATVVLVAILIPAIYQSREQAQRYQSRNNLKQFGLALHNYHDVWECIPPGGVIGPDGTAFHGWLTFTLPFIDGSPLYSRIDLDQPWDSERNAHLFAQQIPMFRIAGAGDEGTTQLYGLLHYPANPNVFHRNSSICFDDLTAGRAHTWLVGEATGNYSPWGYPFNWRPLGARLNAGPAGFGRPTGDGASFVMADGSTRFVSNDIDQNAWAALRDAPPIAPPQATAKPPWPEHYRHSAWKLVTIALDDLKTEGLVAESLVDENGIPRRVQIVSYSKAFNREATINDLRQIVKHFPRARWVVGVPALDDEAASVIAQLSELESLEVPEINITERGLRHLQSLRKLRTLRIRSADDETLERLREALPECEVSDR